jgi:hypothetical protein
MYHNFYVPRREAAPCLELLPLNNNGAEEIKRVGQIYRKTDKIKSERKRKERKNKRKR